MLKHPLICQRKLSIGQVDEIIAASLHILETAGITIQSETICKALEKAGAKVDHASQRVFFDSGMVKEFLNAVPAKWRFHARNPAKSVDVGGGQSFSRSWLWKRVYRR